MFRRNPAAPSKPSTNSTQAQPASGSVTDRVTSILGSGINWRGNLRGSGGIRIEGTFEGEIQIQGIIVVGETGRVACNNIRANTVVVAGTVRGNISAEKLEIRSTGRVWGDVYVVGFSTEEGAFLRGAVRMEEKFVLDPSAPQATPYTPGSQVRF